MKQITKVLLTAIFFLGTLAYAQAPTASLNTMLESYKKVAMAADSIKALDFTYDKVFTVTPKEQLTAMIKAQESSGAPKPKVTSMVLNPTLPVKKYSKGQYTLVNYEMSLQMSLAQPGREKEMEAMLKNPEELASFQKMMKGMLSASLGAGSSIEFEPNSFIANLHQKSKFITINEDHKGWKIVELSIATAATLDKILPTEIYNAYKADIDTMKVEAEKKMKELMEAMSGGTAK